MLAENLPVVSPSRIPADCYNLVQLARRLVGGSLEVGLAGLGENRVLVGQHQWSCWNRKLDALLLSWDDFRPGHRSALHAPVDCTLTVHHAYSRTIIHRVYQSLAERLRWEVDRRRPADGAQVIAWSGPRLR